MDLATNVEEQPKVNTAANKLTTVLFVIYLIALYWILLLKLGVQFSYMAERRASFIPFQHTAILNTENILNVIIFIPLGIYTAILFQSWSFSKKLLFCFLLSLLLEGCQYIFRIGAFDS